MSDADSVLSILTDEQMAMVREARTEDSKLADRFGVYILEAEAHRHKLLGIVDVLATELSRRAWVLCSESLPHTPADVIAVYAWPAASHEVPAWGRASYNAGTWYSLAYGSRVPLCWLPLPFPKEGNGER